MRAIKHTLTERYYAWQNGRAIAQEEGGIEVLQNPRFESEQLMRRPTELPRRLKAEAERALRLAELETQDQSASASKGSVQSVSVGQEQR